MRFFSDVMGIIWEDWGIYVLIFGRNGDNFGSYWHKWVGNFELLRGWRLNLENNRGVCRCPERGSARHAFRKSQACAYWQSLSAARRASLSANVCFSSLMETSTDVACICGVW